LSQQDVAYRPPYAYFGLAGHAEPEEHLRMRASAELDPDDLPERGDLQRLGVQGRGDPAGAGD
jgi:hypothetical protein